MPAVQAVDRAPLKTRVAILFSRFGPYHHARLNAAGRGLSVWGVEACATEDIYAWAKVEGAGTFTRVTLTDHDTGDLRWRRELQQKMRRTLEDIKPQVVVIPGWRSADALSALGWCAENGIPVVVMSESNAWDESRSFWKEWIKSRLVKMCAAGLAGGTAHRDYLDQLGMPRERTFLGYDIVDNDYFTNQTAGIQDQKSKIQVQFGLPEKYFLASARFVEKKNIPRLLDAYGRYRMLAEKSEAGSQKPEIWKLVLLGDGPMKSEITSQLASLDLQAHVLLPGFKQYDELPACYGLASAFVHASTTEQWGLVVNEAMAAGLPVLVSNRCGCAADLVQPGVNGYTFDPGNVEEMARQMFQLSNLSPAQLSTMGAASRRIIADWGPERYATGLRDAVAVALKTPPPRFKAIDRLLIRLLLQR